VFCNGARASTAERLATIDEGLADLDAGAGGESVQRGPHPGRARNAR
jgi:hypothetical protein